MEFLKRKGDHKMEMGEGKEMKMMTKRQALRTVDHPELSLGPSLSIYNATDSTNSSSSSDHSEGGASRKRKYSFDEPSNHSSIDLQLINDPLPMDWEQCLDLQSGRMYYLNRKTQKKSWSRPRDHQEQKLDLELNISTNSSLSEWKMVSSSSNQEGSRRRANDSNRRGNGTMVAVACQNCHLLVMLCRSSPSCPNCKYMHASPVKSQAPSVSEATKPLETLSLLN